MEALDAFLKPLGFSGRKAIWNRRIDDVVEVVELQVSKAQDTATVNAGVLDVEA